MKYYIIGSLANKRVLDVANKLRAADIDAFDQWMASGEGADQHWKDYGEQRGWSYFQTLKSDFVQTAFNFDFSNMQTSDGCVLVMPAGKSAHCELGWFVGSGKKAYILFDEMPERPDLMPANMATGIFTNIEELIHVIKANEVEPSADQLDQVSDPYYGLCTHCGVSILGCRCAHPERDYWGI